MREKLVVSDPRSYAFSPRTLESFLSQKRTSQTGFFVAMRQEDDGVTLWFSNKWHTRILEELEGILVEEAITITENTWRIRMELRGYRLPEEWWNMIVIRWTRLGCNLTPVRSFRRFTR